MSVSDDLPIAHRRFAQRITEVPKIVCPPHSYVDSVLDLAEERKDTLSPILEYEIQRHRLQYLVMLHEPPKASITEDLLCPPNDRGHLRSSAFEGLELLDCPSRRATALSTKSSVFAAEEL